MDPMLTLLKSMGTQAEDDVLAALNIPAQCHFTVLALTQLLGERVQVLFDGNCSPD